jgi:hypothetical protein
MPKYSRRRKRHRNLKLFVYSALIVGVILFVSYQQNQLSGQGLNTDGLPSQVAALSEPWADENYSLRRKLNIDSTKTVVSYTFDHAELVDNNQSKPDGSDIRVIAQDSGQNYPVGFLLTGNDTPSASIKFDVSRRPSALYYFYFNNKSASAHTDTPELQETSANSITASEDESPAISLSPRKYWVLRYKSGAELETNLAIANDVWETGDQLYYVRVGTSELVPLDIGTSWTNPVKINLGQIETGDQGIYLITQHKGNYYRSPNVYFKVSEPVFVAWTIDWEGKNVTDSVLASINKIATTYDMPLTQFFNPRIYVDTSMPDFRRAQLTNWVKARHLINEDEIALHLHMYYDLVKAAGVTPRTTPHWGSGTDGYDVPASTYTTDEMSKVLNWALGQFATNNLPEPAGFRAGGWYANLDTLKAINSTGFVYDSSGRENYKFGSAELAGSWKLTPTTQPYHPSIVDQNTSAPDPVFKIWEIPNNGNDSYWFSADDMISRFYSNYQPGATAANPTLVTYLSHPDWFDVDQPKLTALFLEIDKYSFAHDRGPVIYSTLSSALQEWQE